MTNFEIKLDANQFADNLTTFWRLYQKRGFILDAIKFIELFNKINLMCVYVKVDFIK